MFKIHPLVYKWPSMEPPFTIFSPHSAAMKFKNAFGRTRIYPFSPSKTKFKHVLNVIP